MPFSYPGSSGIRSAGANLTSQVGDISMRAATNIGNIRMQIARMRAAGIQENSETWNRMLAQLGAIATAYPREKRAREAEARAIDDQEMQRAREQRQEERADILLPLEQEQREVTIANQRAAMATREKEKKDAELYLRIISESKDPIVQQARAIELQRPDMAQEIEKNAIAYQESLAKMSAAEIKKESEELAAMAQLVSIYTDAPSNTEPTELNARYSKVISELPKFGVAKGTFRPERNPGDDLSLRIMRDRGLTREQLNRTFKPEGKEPTPSELQTLLDAAEEEKTGKKPTKARSLELRREYDKSLSEGRRKPEDEEIAALRKKLMQQRVAGESTPQQRANAIFNLRELARKRIANFEDLEAFQEPVDKIMEQEAQRIYGMSVEELRGGAKGKTPTAVPERAVETVGVHIRDPKTGRTGIYQGTAAEAKKDGFEVIP